MCRNGDSEQKSSSAAVQAAPLDWRLQKHSDERFAAKMSAKITFQSRIAAFLIDCAHIGDLTNLGPGK